MEGKKKRVALLTLPFLVGTLGGTLVSCAFDEVTITFVLTAEVTLGGPDPYTYLAGDLYRLEMTFPKGFVPSVEEAQEIGRELANRTPIDLYPEDVCPWYTAGAGDYSAINYSRRLSEPFSGTPIEEDRECYYTLRWSCWMVGPPDGWEGDWPPTDSLS